MSTRGEMPRTGAVASGAPASAAAGGSIEAGDDRKGNGGDTPLLVLRDVSREFRPLVTLGDRIASLFGATIDDRPLRAVDGVSLSLYRGETLGLVGESGCGKSTLGRIAAGLLDPTVGQVSLEGGPLRVDGRKTTTRVQTVFQDPFASLDPRMKVGVAIGEGPLAHGLVARREAAGYVADWLEQVGLDPAMAERYPHQFSGGQRQRIAIARALAMRPEILVCDEPVASLDVSIQAQIINLFLDLRERLGLTCLFISHDLSIVRHVSERLAVMYLGRVVEEGPAEEVFERPAHPYTLGLLASVPRLVLDAADAVAFEPIRGELPSPLSPPPGCHFAPRCGWAEARCRERVPAVRVPLTGDARGRWTEAAPRDATSAADDGDARGRCSRCIRVEEVIAAGSGPGVS